ncbi:MAG TPA: glycine--tRNA ligase [Sporichthya sp.]|nr:glycine--tRNA ligase [Sporichthya sp.]
MRPVDRIDAIVNLCRRRGLVFPSSEIYGGTRSSWDYGPLGVELKENIKRQWWKACVQSRDDVVGLDSAIILATDVWKASGHLESFVEPLTECQACHQRWRVDQLAADGDRPLAGVPCPGCGSKDALTEPTLFSGLLRTHLGAVDGPEGVHYLRPETAQGVFVNFANVIAAARRRPPFGVGQVGKSFRNEITPANFLFRTREFEQMELEFFVVPGTDETWHEYWLAERWSWYLDLGIPEQDLRRYEHPANKLSHYAKRTVDIEYRFGFSGGPGGGEWAELEGVANRGDHDLVTHSKNSGSDLSYYDQATGERWTPYVIEPAAGLSRCVLAFLLAAYSEDTAPNAKGVPEKRTVLRLDPRLAPVKAAVLPLSRNPELSPKARELATALRRNWNVDFDDAGAIGRRYRRQDEIGTPFCITLDFETLNDGAATVRDRDSMRQERVSLDRLTGYLAERLVGC